LKKFIVAMILLLMMVPVLAACGGGGSETTNTAGSSGASETKTEAKKEKPKAPDKFLKIGSGPMGSGWYPMTTIASEIFMDNFDGLNASQLEGGSVSNLRSLDKNDIQFAINYTSDFADAVNGRGDFKAPIDSIAAIGSIYPAYQQIVTLEKNTDINKVEDIVSKRIYLGPKGGGGIVAFWRAMEEYGITEETVTKAGGTLNYGSYNDGASMMKDGIVDVFVGGGTPQILAIAEVDLTNPVKVIPHDPAKMESLAGKGYGIASLPLPTGTYKNHKEDSPGYTLESMFTVRKDLPEDYVYYMTRFIWENLSIFKEQQPERAKFMTLDTVLNGIDEKHLHPGAVKYYKEVGVIK
jgi:TRAP transporter TAXI family solute receptor